VTVVTTTTADTMRYHHMVSDMVSEKPNAVLMTVIGCRSSNCLWGLLLYRL